MPQALDILSQLPELAASSTNRVLAWPAGSDSYDDVGYVEAGDLGGNGSSSFTGFNVLDYGTGISNFGNNTTDDQTAVFQSCFDAAKAWADARLCGVKVVIPPGSYRINGTVTIPTMSTTNMEFAVEAYGCRILHKPTTTDVAMFAYANPSTQTEADAWNDKRKLRWFGGWFDGDSISGQKAFDLSAFSRSVMADMHIQAFDIGIKGRFSLNNTFRDIHFNSNVTHDLWLRHGDWSGSSGANSAPNMCGIKHTRSYGAGTNQGLIYVQEAGGTVIEHAVCEGVGGRCNIRISTGNTSATVNTIRDVWCENTCSVADIEVTTLHKVEVGFQFAKSPVRIDASGGGTVVVTQAGYMTAGAQFKAASTTQVWHFMSVASNERFTPTSTSRWVGAVVPSTIYHGLNDSGGAWSGPAAASWALQNFTPAHYSLNVTDTADVTNIRKAVASIVYALSQRGEFTVTIT